MLQFNLHSEIVQTSAMTFLKIFSFMLTHVEYKNIHEPKVCSHTNRIKNKS